MGAFCISPSWEVKIIAGLILIHLHLEKISGRQQLRMVSLLKQYTLNLLLDKHLLKNTNSHQLAQGNLTSRRCQKLKSHVVDSNNYLNSLFPSFDSMYKEISSSFHLVDNFSDCFSFHTVNSRDKDIIKAYLQNLNKMIEDFCIDPETIIIISDTNIKNNVITSISHICSS